MEAEFCGVQRRLDKLNSRLRRLQELGDRSREDFDRNQDLRDIAERNFEVAAQCCIDLANRIIALEEAEKPRDYHEAIARLGEIGVLPGQLAQRLAPMAGFRNVLVHEYAGIDWDEVYASFERLDELRAFARHVAAWMAQQAAE